MTEHGPLPEHLQALLTLDGEPGPAPALSSAAFDAQVARVLSLHAQPTSAPAVRTRRSGSALVWGGVAALAFGSAAAALWLGGTDDAAQPTTGRDPLLDAAPAVAAPAPPEPEHEAAPQPTPEATAVPGATAPTPGVAPPSTPDLLARANRLRADGKYRAAHELYLRVAADARDTLSAHVALVAAGELSLQSLHEPERARRLYERALGVRGDGPLAQEALLGVAASQRALGNAAEERRTLETLLRRHTSGPAVLRAQKRLSELDAAR